MDVYNFSQIDDPALWKNGNYDDLYNLKTDELSGFLSYKESQYQQRRIHVEKVCQFLQNHGKSESEKAKNCNLTSNQRCLILVDPQDKLAFCRNPKVSSSAWLARFKILKEGIMDYKHEFTHQDIVDMHEDADKWWTLSRKEVMTMLLKKPSVLSFVLVRHPLDRLESAYFDKIVNAYGGFSSYVKEIKDKCKIGH